MVVISIPSQVIMNWIQHVFDLFPFVQKFSLVSSQSFLVHIYFSIVNLRILWIPFFSRSSGSTFYTQYKPSQQQLELALNQYSFATDKVVSLTNRIIFISLDVDHLPRYHYQYQAFLLSSAEQLNNDLCLWWSKFSLYFSLSTWMMTKLLHILCLKSSAKLPALLTGWNITMKGMSSFLHRFATNIMWLCGGFLGPRFGHPKVEIAQRRQNFSESVIFLRMSSRSSHFWSSHVCIISFIILWIDISMSNVYTN